MTKSEIVSRSPVSLSGHLPNIVSKMFDQSVLDETIVEKITYLSDGLKVNGYLAQPSKAGRYPLLIWNRGGDHNSGALDDLLAYLILASTAVWGYVVLATQYRGNMGSEGSEDWGGKDLSDCLNLLKVAEEIDNVDMSRLAIEGASRGGMTTYRALKVESRFRCAIIHAGITDLPSLIKIRPEFGRFVDKTFGSLSSDEKENALREISAVYFAEQLPKSTPLLIMHGDADDRVPLAQSESLVERLKKYEIDHRFEVIEGAGHIALKDGSYKKIDNFRRSWLAEHLGDSK